MGVQHKEAEAHVTFTRRDFLVGAGTLGVGLAAAGLVGCSPATTSTGSEPTATATPSEVLTCDVVVLGTGTAGIVAALRASELGAKVIVLEKLSTAGGTSYVAEGLCGIGSKLQEQMGITVAPDQVFNDAMAYHHWAANGPVLRSFVDNSGTTIDWLMDHGVPFVASIGLGNSYPVWHIFNGVVGPNLIEPLQAKAAEAGVQFRFETPATQLLVENGAAAGVLAAAPDGSVLEVDASAVILCTGGFSNSSEMFEKYVGVSLDGLHTWGMDGRDGDGIAMGLSADAALHIPSSIMYCGAMVAGTTKFYDMANLVTAYQPNLRVNEYGQRCFNEGIVFDFTAHGNALGAQAENYSIIDQDYIDLLTNVGCFNSIPTAGFFPGDKLEGVTEALEGNENIVKANSIEELAELLGLDGAALAGTIETYNAYCEAGFDAAFGKPAIFLQAVKTAPFYGVKLGRTFFTTVGGLRVDEYIRVVNANGDPIPGLYACGSDAGGMYGYNYDVNVASGSQQGWAATSGRLAAEHAVEEYLG